MLQYILFTVLILIYKTEAKLSKLSALRQSTFHGYDHLVNPDEKVTVMLGVTLLSLDISPQKQILTSHAWLRLYWKDPRLTWVPGDWNNVTQINVDASEVWLPDIVPYNGEQVRAHAITFREDLPKVILFFDGEMMFEPPTQHRTFCPVNFAQWPWGQQSCNLTFGSWTYHQGSLDIIPYESPSVEKEAVDTKRFVNPRIDIVSTSVEKKVNKYDCCPDLYPSLTFNIVFRQNTIYMNDTEMRAP